MMVGVHDYEWVGDLEAYCLTAVVGLDPAETVRRLGGDPAGPTSRRTFDECFWPANGPQWAQIGTVDGGVLVAEHNGWRAEEIVEPLSRGARVACFYRNVQAVMHFVYAVNGQVQAEFDPLLERTPRGGANPRCLDGLLADLPFGLFAAEASALRLVERVTGVRITRSWLDSPQHAVCLPPLPAIAP
ncbi:MAG: hypothetical protein IRY92_07290 [Dactylosporangium sp.]|nr:hypothetical protein [Dactylosporangium sp.]